MSARVTALGDVRTARQLDRLDDLIERLARALERLLPLEPSPRRLKTVPLDRGGHDA